MDSVRNFGASLVNILQGSVSIEIKPSIGSSSPGLSWHLLQVRKRPGHCQNALEEGAPHQGEGIGKTQLVGQRQIPSGKWQGKHELSKQKQEMEGLEQLQTCSDMPAPRNCRGFNNAALCGVEVLR